MRPISAPGLIVAALELRRDAGVAPFTVMSCDNLPANGKTTGAHRHRRSPTLRDPGLAGLHRARNVAFPSTMVDRIVPATTDADRETVRASDRPRRRLADHDRALHPVGDRGPLRRRAARPSRRAGAQLVEDVEPFELMKLRMLNGSHSTLAYLGYLAGYQYVSEADRRSGDPDARSTA